MALSLLGVNQLPIGLEGLVTGLTIMERRRKELGPELALPDSLCIVAVENGLGGRRRLR